MSRIEALKKIYEETSRDEHSYWSSLEQHAQLVARNFSGWLALDDAGALDPFSSAPEVKVSGFQINAESGVVLCDLKSGREGRVLNLVLLIELSAETTFTPPSTTPLPLRLKKDGSTITITDPATGKEYTLAKDSVRLFSHLYERCAAQLRV